MARYLWNEKTLKLELIDPDGYKDPNAGLNGPVWCPEQGYYDPVLNKHFESKRQKRDYMRENGLMMEGGKQVKKLEGRGRNTLYFFNS